MTLFTIRSVQDATKAVASWMLQYFTQLPVETLSQTARKNFISHLLFTFRNNLKNFKFVVLKLGVFNNHADFFAVFFGKEMGTYRIVKRADFQEIFVRAFGQI